MLERKRLHISPLNPDLLPIVLPPSLLQHASDISYHTLQTFPERNYGYVNLPAIEAEKIKKKLNGSILKGSKMRIEEARPEKRKKHSGEKEESGTGLFPEDGARKVRKKTKKEDGVLPGYELPKERKVKRGWTEVASNSMDRKLVKGSKEKKRKKTKVQASTFTGEPECLFKTTLPPNALKLADTSSTKVKKTVRGKSDREFTIHEFSNTTKHASFLRDTQVSGSKKAVSEYVDGKGWVDDDHTIIEAEPQTRRTKSNFSKAVIKSSNGGPGEGVGEADSKSQLPVPQAPSARQAALDDTSSSGSSSSSCSDGECNDNVNMGDIFNASSSAPTRLPNPDQDDTSESVSANDKASRTPEVVTPPVNDVPSSQVHPLEALFKRPSIASTGRKPTLELQTSFSFFSEDAVDPTDTDASIHPNPNVVPQTPFTRRDFRERRQRSAAPTPDTAAVGKSFKGVWGRGRGDDDDDDDDDASDDEDSEKEEEGDKMEGAREKAAATGGDSGAVESEFSKWFWEHRGETNRAWKRRRREAAKEKRWRGNTGKR